MTVDFWIWVGIFICLSQSAMFSGLNLAFFSLSRLQLEVEAKRGNDNAEKILSMREDSNFLLATILWGNVSINVLLTLLSDSVLVGVSAFLFSTFAITFFGEIFPQAYFSRHALRVASKLTPIIRFYQFLLFPFAKFTSILLDGWLGKEGITYFRENELRGIILAHMQADEAEVEHVEGVGALNFLTIEEVKVHEEGEPLHPDSVIPLPCRLDLPSIPEPGQPEHEAFIRKVHVSGCKWVVLTDEKQIPRLVLDADGYLRSCLLDNPPADPYGFCHRPVVIKDAEHTLGNAMAALKLAQEADLQEDDVIDHDVILVWAQTEKRVITGADILGRLLKGIEQPAPEIRDTNDTQPSDPSNE